MPYFLIAVNFRKRASKGLLSFVFLLISSYFPAILCGIS